MDLATGSWVEKHKQLRIEFGHTASYQPWRRICSDGGFQNISQSQRQSDLLELAWMCRSKKKRTVPWYIDLSQSADRRSWSSQPHCLATSTILYSYGLQRLLTSSELMVMQGYDPSSVSGLETVSNQQRRHATGEGMALPCIGSIMLALALSPTFAKHRSGSKPISPPVPCRMSQCGMHTCGRGCPI